jgi:mono/diheme cytochrome c family protein
VASLTSANAGRYSPKVRPKLIVFADLITHFEDLTSVRSIALSTALLFVSVILAAQARPTTNRPAEELYKANCVMCHMPDGNAAIPNMNFVDGKWLHGNTPAQLAKVITNGVPGTAMMPFKERFSDAEILGLAKFVMAFDKTHKAPAAKKPAVKPGTN